ncbi:helix-turn-helix domain-containing protein [Clostridium paraputrificum]|uniref:helix-turn-helix domain-containing protein n=1 Tax=Clostridium paraputrificum TaxID=29363 RepID=UPI000412EF4C|nr:helix-turn-helix domain-containing protein [Clostridium paraputrificum]
MRMVIANAETIENIGKEINPSAAFLYVIILGHRNGKTGECFVTQANLAEKTGFGERTVRDNLRKLKEAGYLDWVKGSNFSSKANSYIFPKENTSKEVATIEKAKLTKKNKVEAIKKNIDNKEIKIGARPNVNPMEKMVTEEKKKMAELIKLDKDLRKRINRLQGSQEKIMYESKIELIFQLIRTEKPYKIILEETAELVDNMGLIEKIELKGVGTLKDFVYVTGWDGRVKKYA